jgi:hypothetical protein
VSGKRCVVFLRILKKEKLLNLDYISWNHSVRADFSRKEKRHASSRFESRNVHHTIELIVHELMSTPAHLNLFFLKNT